MGTPLNKRVGVLSGAVVLAQIGTTVDPFFSGEESAVEPYADDSFGLWTSLGAPWTSKAEADVEWAASTGAYVGLQTIAPWMLAGSNIDVVIRLRDPLPSPINVDIIYGKNLDLGVSLDKVVLGTLSIAAGQVLAKATLAVVNPMGGSPGSDGMIGFVVYTNGTVMAFPVGIESCYAQQTIGSNLHTNNAFFDGVTDWTVTPPGTIHDNFLDIKKNAPLKTYLKQVLPAGADKAQFWAVRIYCRQTGGGLVAQIGNTGVQYQIRAGWNMFRAITYDSAPGIELQIKKVETGDGLTDTIIDFVYTWYAVVQGEVLTINPLDGAVIDTFLAGDPGQVVGPCKIGWNDSMPVSGSYQAGDRIYNTTASSGGPTGWICEKDGNPGLWTTLPETVA